MRRRSESRGGHAHARCSSSDRLSSITGANVYLKREDLQTVRSYKLRGAYNLLVQLSAGGARRGRGVLVGGQPCAGLRLRLPDARGSRSRLRTGQDAEAKARPHPLSRRRVHRADRRRVDLRSGGRGRARRRRTHRSDAGPSVRRPAHHGRPGHDRRRTTRTARRGAGSGGGPRRRRRMHRRNYDLSCRADDEHRRARRRAGGCGGDDGGAGQRRTR